MTMAIALKAYDNIMKGFLPAKSESLPHSGEEIEESKVNMARRPPKTDIDAPKLRTNGCQIGNSIP